VAPYWPFPQMPRHYWNDRSLIIDTFDSRLIMSDLLHSLLCPKVSFTVPRVSLCHLWLSQ